MAKKDLTNVQIVGKIPTVDFYVPDDNSDSYWHGQMLATEDRGQIAVGYQAFLVTIDELSKLGAFPFSNSRSAGLSHTPQHEVDDMPGVYTDAPPKPSPDDPVFEPGYRGWPVLVHEVLKTAGGGLDCVSLATKGNGELVYDFPIFKIRQWEVDLWLKGDPERTPTFDGPQVLTWQVGEGTYTYEDKEGNSHTRRYVNMVDLVPANEYTVKRNDPESMPANNGNGSTPPSNEEPPWDRYAARAKYSNERVALCLKWDVPAEDIPPATSIDTPEDFEKAWKTATRLYNEATKKHRQPA